MVGHTLRVAHLSICISINLATICLIVACQKVGQRTRPIDIFTEVAFGLNMLISHGFVSR